MSPRLLEVEGLNVVYHSGGLVLRGLVDVSLTLDRGRALGVVGESGSGKSTLSFAINRLLPKNAAIVSGHISFDAMDIAHADEATLQALRGDRIAMISQDPLSSLHPCIRIGKQMADAQTAHRQVSSGQREARSAEMLRLVGMADAEQSLKKYQHEFSGGMRQRIVIACALLMKPDLLIADEPTSALDVLLQAQIIDLLGRLRQQLGTAIIIVSHDLGVIRASADEVLVMYAGEVMENCDALSLFDDPLHPYTQALIRVTPRRKARGEVLQTIPGRVPSASEAIQGCAFASRCAMARPACVQRRPILAELGRRRVRCHIYDPSSGWHEQAPASARDRR